MAVSAVRKYFTLGGCCGPEITSASYRQINGSNEVSLGIPLGGTVLFLPVKAKTNWGHSKNTPSQISTFQVVLN